MTNEPTSEEWPVIRELDAQLVAVLDNSQASPTAQAYAAIKLAARYAGRAKMPVDVAFAMLSGYVIRGEPT
jgi:hypothetical protein